ncbi:MAG: ion transporter [Pirellulaceae bacterium]|nr:ion transporter [Pirellulaceae bacterium]
MAEQLKRFTTSAVFGRTIVTLILLTGVLVGLETYPEFGPTTAVGRVVGFVQDVILGLFVLEMVLKILACGKRPWEYFYQPWNVFDFVIIAICVLPLGAQYAAVFRLARILRTLRMISILPRLQVLVGALLRSIPSLVYVGLLLGLHFYVYAVVGTFMFRDNDPVRFGSLHKSTLTLFQVLTLEGWNDVLATEFHGSDGEYPDSWKEMSQGVRKSQAQPLIASAYFVSFILFGTMIMLNLFTGVIISSLEDAQAELVEEVSKKRLTETGVPTLREELSQIGNQLREISERLHGLELRQEDRAPTDGRPDSGEAVY